MKKLLCPSMMCANFANLEKEVKELENAGADIFHVDFMDGNFVPNYGMGLQDLELIRQVSGKKVDVHLMIENPGRYVQLFCDKGADIIYVHPEADNQVTRTIETIKNNGKSPGIAINPGTSVEVIRELLPLVEYVLVMTVNPGFAGQKYLAFVNDKIKQLVSLSKNYGFKIMVDGAISEEKVHELSEIGVQGFILGTSALFNKNETYSELLNDLRK